MPKPLLLISDSISASTGLARITRDLAVRIHEHLGDVYRLATAGYGGVGSRRFPFPEYHLNALPDWQIPELPQIALDFAPDEELIIFCIWDLTRLGWFAEPRTCTIPPLRGWLEEAKIKKWAYPALDASGPNGKLSVRQANIMKGFDRVLDYSAFSCGVTGNTEHLPHGIDTSVFKPQDRLEAKRHFRKLGFQGLTDNSFLVGIVATNQARKDWSLGIQTCRILLDRGLDVKLWCHVDVLERAWSLPNLIADYGLAGRVVITTEHFSDEQMAGLYSACDVTLSIGLGEGFGYPTYESLACGTPVVAGDYCGSEWMNDPLVKPVAYRYESLYSCKRPVYDPEDWGDMAVHVSGAPAEFPAELDWNNLWPRWESWFREGAK